jgi:hypothetical protein
VSGRFGVLTGVRFLQQDCNRGRHAADPRPTFSNGTPASSEVLLGAEYTIPPSVRGSPESCSALAFPITILGCLVGTLPHGCASYLFAVFLGRDPLVPLLIPLLFM